MVELMEIARVLLIILRLVLFALALGLTLISFQAYSRRKSDRLESAFIGFAFISMGVGVAMLSSQTTTLTMMLDIVETIPFIIGFGMLYLSLYR